MNPLTHSILGGGFRLGSLFGIPISANWTLLPVALLITWSLAPLVGVVPALAATVLLFGSIVAHELGHALTARRYGIYTQGITLHLFGGVARLLSEPRTPRQEFMVAIAGPVVSLALALLLGGIGGLGVWLGVEGIEVLGWLMIINLILAFFNLLPGYPLDGGRVLRAFLWKRSGSMKHATRMAALGGVWVAYGLMALGLLGALGIIPMFGIMTVLIGLFLLSLARSEERRARLLPDGQPAWEPPRPRFAPTSGTGSVVQYVVRYPDGREVIYRVTS